MRKLTNKDKISDRIHDPSRAPIKNLDVFDLRVDL